MVVEQTSSVPSNKVGMAPSRRWPELEWQPDVALRLFGMRRSGNHAIANWLQRNAPAGKALFFNNCKPGRMPLLNHRGVEHDAQRLSRQDGSDLAALGAKMKQGGLLLISYEDAVPSDFSIDRPLSGNLDESLLNGDILLIRGFLNWSASLLKKLQRNSGVTLAHRGSVVLRAIDSYRRMLELATDAEALALTLICYDDWISDAAYRADCLSALGLPCLDNSLGAIQPYGGGSSFEPFTNEGADLASDQRWQQMAEDPEYQAILHLAARDDALCACLERQFPQDAVQLSKLAVHTPFAAGGLE
ncbi:hypothetical protein [Phaeobacter porticola]|nr:hypothetical protein [Phaeobacter porticola]